MTYQPGIPTGTVDLDTDYKNIQGNFQALDNTFGVDHIRYSNRTNQRGYHTAVHLNPQATPAQTVGVGQLYSSSVNDGFSTDTILNWLTGGNLNIPFTRNFSPVVGTFGSTFIAGGAVLQWGINPLALILPIQDGVVTFATLNKAFPTACYIVQMNVISAVGASATNQNTISVVQNSVSATSFSFRYRGDGTCSGFFWWAIGA